MEPKESATDRSTTSAALRTALKSPHHAADVPFDRAGTRGRSGDT